MVCLWVKAVISRVVCEGALSRLNERNSTTPKCVWPKKQTKQTNCLLVAATITILLAKTNKKQTPNHHKTTKHNKHTTHTQQKTCPPPPQTPQSKLPSSPVSLVKTVPTSLNSCSRRATPSTVSLDVVPRSILDVLNTCTRILTFPRHDTSSCTVI